MALISFFPPKVFKADFNGYVHRDATGTFYVDIDGYHFYLPQCSDYHDVVCHFMILDESFKRGISLTNVDSDKL